MKTRPRLLTGVTTHRQWIVIAALVTLLSACAIGRETARSNSIMRAAEDVPDRFLVGTPNSPDTTEPSAGDNCRNPMVDPRNGRRLKLIRSSGGMGDYEVENGGYGLRENELLRLECGTGEALGIVRR